MTAEWLLRAVVLTLAVLGAAVLVRSLWRDLRRARRRADPQADLVALYHLLIAAACAVALLIAAVAALAAPGFVGLAAIPFLLGLAAAVTIRFVPATHPAWGRLIRRLRTAG
jgi:hypothetical protein